MYEKDHAVSTESGAQHKNECFRGSPQEYQMFLKMNEKASEEYHECMRDGNQDESEGYDAVEDRHFSGICEALSNYAFHSMAEVARMESSFHSLSKDDKDALIDPIEQRIEDIKRCVLVNQQFLDLLLLDQSPYSDSEAQHSSVKTSRHLQPNTAKDASPNKAHNCSIHHETSSKHVDAPGVSPSTYSTHQNPLPTSDSPKAEVVHPRDCVDQYPPKSSPHFGELDIPDSVRNNNISKVRSTLRQFVRDWSVEGKPERDAAYGPLLTALEDMVPLKSFIEKHNRIPRVLCPGSGLGRLPFEVARRGYGCQGNEFSFFMLLGSNLILNSKIPPQSLIIYPYCLSTSNRIGHRDHLVEVRIPDVSPVGAIEAGKDFSMCAGEFVEVYWEQDKQWDAILTCFFIDTAKNVLQYIKTVARIVKEGGLWANFGPLLYHFSDLPNEVSIELSYEEIRSVIERYFTIVKESWHEAYYTANPSSMMQVRYNCIYFVALRNAVPVCGVSNPVY